MNLNVFGNLSLEHDGKVHRNPYIPLLALCYLAIEGKKEREEIINLVQAADVNRISRMSRNDPERGREDETYKVALRNFRVSISKLKKAVGPSPFKDVDHFSTLEINPDLECNYDQVVELFKGSEEEQLEAIKIYEQEEKAHGFLANFEDVYGGGSLKQHYDAATEFVDWVETKQNELNSLYLAAKSKQEFKSLSFQALQNLLPQDGSNANGIDAEFILKLVYADFKDSERQKCLIYIEDYIPIHLQHFADEGVSRQNAFLVLQAMGVLDSPETKPIQSSYKLSNDDFESILQDLVLDAWISEDSFKFHDVKCKELLRNRLRRDPEAHIELVKSLCPNINIVQQLSLLRSFFINHTVTEATQNDIAKLVDNCCHALIKEQQPEQAVELSGTLINQMSEEVTETHFVHCYALERCTHFVKAEEQLKENVEKADDESELYDKLIALRASVLSRIKGGKLLKKAARLAAEALDGSSQWASAEAYNVLGRLSYLKDDISDAKTKFNRSAMLWETLDEPLRQLDALSNIAVCEDENGKGKLNAVAAAYDMAVRLAHEREVSGDAWVRLIVNQAAFFNDAVVDEHPEATEETKEKVVKMFKNVERALKIEKLGSDVEFHGYFNLGYFYEMNKELPLKEAHAKAKNHYNIALEIAKESNQILEHGLAISSIAELEEDLDSYELAIDEFFTKAQANIHLDGVKKTYRELVIQLLNQAKSNDKDQLTSELQERLNKIDSRSED